MTTEIENGKPVVDPQQVAEAEEYKKQANEFFKSELKRKINLRS